MTKKLIYKNDQYGVRNYNATFLALISLGILYLCIAVFSPVLLHFESLDTSANITSYEDAIWVLMMSASTIGFGDYYPVTIGGRVVVAIMFYIGVGMVGFIGALLADRILGFADTNVKNRELRMQNDEILAHNLKLEAKLDYLITQVQTLSEYQSNEK